MKLAYHFLDLTALFCYLFEMLGTIVGLRLAARIFDTGLAVGINAHYGATSLQYLCINHKALDKSMEKWLVVHELGRSTFCPWTVNDYSIDVVISDQTRICR